MAGQPITLTIPAVGTAGTAYASQINTALTTLEVELERKVVPGDMNINADLNFLSGVVNSSAVGLKRIGLTLQSAASLTAAAFPMSAFAAGSDGDLFFNDNFGRQIQITTNGTVNVSTTGGITSSAGAYGTGGVEIRWDSGDVEYELRSGTGTNSYASARLDDVYLADGSSNFIRLTAPSIATDYVVTLPTAVPASTSVVLMDNVGTLSTTRAVAVDTITTTSTIASTGLITATAGVTAAANQHVTVSGTGQYKHGSLTKIIHASAGTRDITDGAALGLNGWTAAAIGDIIYIPVVMETGQRITGVRMRGNDVSAGSFCQGQLFAFNAATLAFSQVGGNLDTSTAGTGAYSILVNGLTETVAAGTGYVFKWVAGAVGDTIALVEIFYDRV